MTELGNGGPAFPDSVRSGMTLRDWFAGQAIAGLTTAPRPVLETVAHAYEIADTAIKMREVTASEVDEEEARRLNEAQRNDGDSVV